MAELGLAGVIHDELALEPDVAEDGHADTAVALEAAEARTARRGRGVVEVVTRDRAGVVADREADVGKGGRAGEDVATVVLAIGGTLDVAPVVRNDGVVDKDERGSGVGDGLDRRGRGGAGANGVAVGSVAPESLTAVDIGVADIAGMFAVVNVSEVVVAGLTLLKVGGEQRGVEVGLGVVEESLLRGRLDGVDAGES